MTITNKIKDLLMYAEMEYNNALDSYKTKYPSGTDFRYDTVSAQAAEACIRLYQTEAAYNALAGLVEAKYNPETMNRLTRLAIDKYNNAQTDAEITTAENEYYALYKIETR